MFSQPLRRRFAPGRPIRQRHWRPRLEQLESRLTLSAIGADFRISHLGPDGDADFVADKPAVAYNSRDNEYFVVWAGREGETSRIYGQRLDAATRDPLGDAVLISEGDSPAVAYNSIWNEYLVVWDQNAFIGGLFGHLEREVFGGRVTARGEHIETFEISSTTDASAFNPTVAHNSIANEYLVAWEGTFNYRSIPVDWESEIFGQRLSQTGTELGDNDFRISSMGPDGIRDFDAHDPAVTFNATQSEYLVVWSGDDDTGSLVDDEFEVYGQFIDAAPATFGEFGADDFRISNMGPSGDATYDALHPALAYNSANDEYLVVWDGNDGSDTDTAFEIYGQRLSGATGLPAGESGFAISDLGPLSDRNFDAARPAVAYNRATNRYVVVWSGDDDIAPLVDDELEIFGQTLDANPATFREIGPNDFRISAMGPNGDTGFEARMPAIASSHTEFLTVWSGDDDTAPLVKDEFEIFGHRVGSTYEPEAFFETATRELLLYGSTADDALHLSVDVQGNIVISSAGKIVTPIDPASGQSQTPNLANTQSINGYLRDGDDRFDFDSAGFQGGCNVKIIGEDGSDSLTFRSPDKAIGEQALASFSFDGGDGSDIFDLIATDLSEQVTLISTFDPKAGTVNTLRVEAEAGKARLADFVAAAESLFANLGGGDDTLAAAAEWAGIIGPIDLPVPLNAAFNLGEGADSLQFDFNAKALSAGLNLQVDAGGGDDNVAAGLVWDGIIGPPDLPVDLNAAFNLADGDDSLQFDFDSEALNSSLNLQVDAGGGNDDIAAGLVWDGVIGPIDLPVALNAAFNLGDGADTLELNGSINAMYAYITLAVETGPADDLAEIAFASPAGAVTPCDIVEDVTLNLGAGDDTLVADVFSEAEETDLKLNVDAGSGDDDAQVTFACPDDPYSNMQPTDFVAHIAANLSDGDDVFQLHADSSVADTALDVKVDAGSGEDDVLISSNSINGLATFDIGLGADDDLLLFEENTFEALTLNVNAGTGNDVIEIPCDLFTGPTKLNLNLGAGNDSFTLMENTFTQGLTLNVIAATGNDVVSIPCDLFTGPTKFDVDLGAGNDRLAIRESTFQQLNLIVRAGTGKDRVNLEANIITDTSKLMIDLGAGLDTYYSRRNKLAKNVVVKVTDPDRR